MSVPTRGFVERAVHPAPGRLRPSAWLDAWRTVEVVGRVTDEGVCAERIAGDDAWTARVRLQPWAQCGAAPTDEPLEIEWGTDTASLARRQRMLEPGDEVRLRVRMTGDALRAKLAERR
ncbi:DUF7021 domain-containing protein [Lysobacter xanthus]